MIDPEVYWNAACEFSDEPQFTCDCIDIIKLDDSYMVHINLYAKYFKPMIKFRGDPWFDIFRSQDQSPRFMALLFMYEIAKDLER